jgi:hypothetical protein
MTNGDYNPFMQPERLSNDHKIAMITIFGTAIAAVIVIALIILAIK